MSNREQPPGHDRAGGGDPDSPLVDGFVNLARTEIDQRLRERSGEQPPARLIEAAARRGARAGWRGALVVWAIPAAGAAVLAAVLVTNMQRGRQEVTVPSPAPADETLSYVQEREPAATAVAPAAAAAAAVRYRFSDGTVISAPADVGVRVEDVHRQRPRIRVAGGAARVRVIHRPDARWTFVAGPYEVLVTGTAFDLGWDAGKESLSLGLHEGSVLLRGPRLRGGSLPVHAGQRVLVSASGEVLVREEASDVPLAPAPAPTTAPPPVEPAPAPRHEAAASWSELVRKGQFDRVIAAAGKSPRAWHDCQAHCPADDLRALGDAARYSNRLALAGDAFRALRRRFAGKSEGQTAGYLLGRTFEAGGKWAEAARWYATYLSEAPSGEFAVEAASGRARAASHL